MKISSTKINKYITSNKYDFKRFKMHYSSKEILSIDTFNINKFANFSHFGSYKDLKNINEFLSTLGDNNKILVNIMEKIIYNINWYVINFLKTLTKFSILNCFMFCKLIFNIFITL